MPGNAEMWTGGQKSEASHLSLRPLQVKDIQFNKIFWPLDMTSVKKQGVCGRDRKMVNILYNEYSSMYIQDLGFWLLMDWWIV